MKKLIARTILLYFISIGFSYCELYAKLLNISKVLDNDALEYKDRIYNPNIKTVNLYINKEIPGATNDPPVISIKNPRELILEFDELAENARYFKAYIIHCNWDWSPSQLRPIEYLSNYNEFEIVDYEYSFNTKTLYTHYSYTLPSIYNVPGNYLLVVTDKDNPDELILSRRFMVFDNMVRITPKINISTGIKERRTHQQIEFEISYQGLEIYNPEQEIKVVIRQNQSWLTAIYNLKPTIVRDSQKNLEYHHFNLENNFFGGNEFRFFDLNSVKAPGQNVERVFVKDNRYDAFLFPEKDRSYAFYGIWNDINGGFVISNIDGRENNTEAEYVNVHFFLESAEKLPTEVYIYGKLSDYDLLPSFKMNYNKELGGYMGDAFLKQGWYDYIFFTPDEPYMVEGSHFETRNDYEILVYHQPQGKITQYLIGYVTFNNQP